MTITKEERKEGEKTRARKRISRGRERKEEKENGNEFLKKVTESTKEKRAEVWREEKYQPFPYICLKMLSRSIVENCALGIHIRS